VGAAASQGPRGDPDLHGRRAGGDGGDGRRRRRRDDRVRSGRERGSFDFLPTVCCAISDDEEAAYEAARRTICFYATVRTYRPLWEAHGFGDAAAAVGEAFRRGDLASMPGHVPDEMVDTYCAAGPVDKVRERAEQVAERGDGIWT
jgi:alkanesulfonate monooxygenase SsuD/methylene tetrahydromethanopterin reductase-like flavin-dependent oxidoreductase (luciferase family)